MGCFFSTPETADSRKGNVTIPGRKEKPTRGKYIKEESTHDFYKMDEHAKKAPKRLNNSAEDLVNYLSAISKDPRMLVRGFFVWTSENIKYDVDGLFGRTARAPCDAQSVMKGGRSVCEGYANVMELLCRKADIPVKTLSGFAKGYGHSAANQFTVKMNTNHAWNAVQLEGKWYLIDSTWGAGYLDQSSYFKKEFNDFYFLTDPRQFVSAHFPYMDENMKESMKWQLLSKPISLDEFNRNIKYKPVAFKLGIRAISHPHGYIEMKNELQMTFKSVGKEEIVLSARLMLQEGNMLYEQPNAYLGIPEKKNYKLLVRPPKPGAYKLSVFGKTVSDESLQHIPEVMEYAIKCTEVKDKNFEYPYSFDAAGKEKTVLIEPLRRTLPANTAVKFRVSAPFLQNIRFGGTYLEKSGTTFSGTVTTGAVGQEMSMFGTRGDKYSLMNGLYAFKTV